MYVPRFKEVLPVWQDILLYYLIPPESTSAEGQVQETSYIIPLSLLTSLTFISFSALDANLKVLTTYALKLRKVIGGRPLEDSNVMVNSWDFHLFDKGLASEPGANAI